MHSTPLQATPLCRCICGSGRNDYPLDGGKACEFEIEEEAPYDVSCQNNGLASYHDTTDQPLRGSPIREGRLYLLSAEEEVQPVELSLFVNGMQFSHQGREVSVSFSPFALVRNCKFQSNGDLCSFELSEFKCFKVSLFTQGLCFYYGVRSEDEAKSEEDRSHWVIDISRAMRLVTQSLFPLHRIACEPVRCVDKTQRRLMASYLLHHDAQGVTSVLYCELHPQSSSGIAKLVLYENESCQVHMMDILITERSSCCEKVGINCSCFSIEDHQFASRTLTERRLWLRAISNIKVKLQNRAPSPTREELGYYRIAIQEHIKSTDTDSIKQAPMDALLQRSSGVAHKMLQAPDLFVAAMPPSVALKDEGINDPSTTTDMTIAHHAAAAPSPERDPEACGGQETANASDPDAT